MKQPVKSKSNKKEAKPEKKRIVLLDAHAILHRAYHALPDFAASNGEPTGALFGLSTMLFAIVRELKPDYIIAAFDLAKPTYRHEVYADYKAGRKKIDDNLIKQFTSARELFKAFNIPIYEKEGFEADDVLGTICENLKDDKNVEIVIASGDMDTLQLVTGKKVQVYTLKKGIKDTILYDEKAVLERFGFGSKLLPDYKGLRGDPSDNIIGIHGIGEKTATILITQFGTIEKIYKAFKKDRAQFTAVGITERIQKLLEENQEEAEFSKMLATIRRDAPIDFVIPEKKWREGVDHARIKNMFQELEFRTLGGRLNEVLGVAGDDADASGSGEAKVAENVDPQQLVETSIMLWILNSNMSDPTLEDIYTYTKTSGFTQARGIILYEIEKVGLKNIFTDIEKPIIPIITKMQKAGVKIDVKKLANLSKEYHTDLTAIEKRIYAAAGQEFNINSPKQMAEILFEKMGLTYKGLRKTSSGKYSTKEEVLDKLALEHPIAQAILEYREIQKLLSTYIDSLPTQVADDGRIHAQFIQAGAATGRFSSKNPNLQNIPVGTERGKKIREAFVADKGKVLMSFDYSQIELRIAAFLSNDEKLIGAFKNGEDIHTAVAAEVFGVKPAEVDKEQRRKAKVINFGILYGMGVSALQKNLGTDRKTAQEFYNRYFESYPGLAKYIEHVKAETADRGYTTTLFGRRRYFEGFKSPLPFIRASAERMAINAPIQGTQADVIKIAMARIDEFLVKNGLEEKARLILQIHDELIYEVDKSAVDDLPEKIKKIMADVLTPEQTKGVPILTECAMGDSWGDLKKV